MESPPRKLPPKKDVLDAFLGNGSARIFLDPRRTGVIVPKWFAKQPELVLRVGYTLSPPIPDLVVSDEAVSCTLSFNRAPFWCKMPWNAVFAVVSDVDGRGVVWPDDVPIESQLLKPARPKPKLASVGSKEESRPPEPEPSRAEEDAASEEPKAEPPVEEVAKDEPKEPEAASTEEPKPDADKEDGSAKKTKRQLPPYLRVVK